jgi:hypothetical protein
VTAGVVSADVTALARGVLKAMLIYRIKYLTTMTTSALLALTLAGAGLWQLKTLADGKAPADMTFRVTVNEVLRDDSTVVTQIDIATPPRSTVEIFCDKGKGAGSTLSSEATDPKHPNAPSHMQVIVFADHVEGKRGATGAVKFLLAHKVGSIYTTTSETVPMPDSAKVLSDVLTVPIKSGEYRFGRATRLVSFKGVSYRLVVNGPK